MGNTFNRKLQLEVNTLLKTAFPVDQVPTQPAPADGLHRKGVEVDTKAPFQVVGLQQAWNEDGLALYACVVPTCQSVCGSKATYSKSWRNKVSNEVSH